jgi:hypothetical protein
MKKLSVLIFVTLIAFPAFSQFKAGIKAGVSTNSITMNKAVDLTGQAGSYTVQALSNSNYGFHGGLFLRLTIMGVYIQPEVLFATSENTYTVKLNGTKLPDVTQKFNNLSIPVMIGVKLGPIRINAGPAASMAITTPKALIENDQNLKTLYNKMSFGYQVGLGFDLLKKLTFDIRYEGSLQKYQTKIQQAVGSPVSLDNRPNAFLLSLGLMF